MMRSLLLALLALTSFVCCLCYNEAEKALEDVIKEAMSVDLSLYNRDEELLVNVINQDGYGICKATINRQRRDQLDCKFKDIKVFLKDGDNTFSINVYSLKSGTILKGSEAHFYYDNIGKNWISRALKGAQNHILCTFRSGEECTTQVLQSRWRTAGSKVFGVGGILLAGAYATYSGPLKLAVTKDLISKSIQRAKEIFGISKASPHEDASTTAHDGQPNGGPKSDNDNHQPSPPSQQLRPPRSAAGVLAGVRRNVHKFATARPTQYAAFLLAAGLMNRERLPVQAIRTQLVNLKRRVATKVRLGNSNSVVIEIPLESASVVPTEVAVVASAAPSIDAAPVPQVQQQEPTLKVALPPSPPPPPSSVMVVRKKSPLLLALLMRIKDALCDTFHAQPPARRQYLSRILATGVVVSVRDATELSKRLTVRDAIAAVVKGLQLVLSIARVQKKPV